MPGPLSDVRILDLTWVLSGPYASMVLCDLGADVIKVERPPWGDVARTTGPHINGESVYFFSINRGKRSITLDLSSEKGREVFLRLVEKADVVMENFTPGTMDALGLGYEVLNKVNPRLIYSATSGFGQSGPLRDKPALDIIVQGMGGVMSITGEPDGPPIRPGLSLGDIAAGLFTAVGILSALHERERSGEGQMVDVSMLDCQVAILENAFSRYFATGEIPAKLGTRHPAATPFQAFPTKDGHIVLALAWGTENQWELFCATIDRTGLINDERFQTSGDRTANHGALEPLLNEALQQKTTAEWLALLEPLQIPCGPLNNIAQAADHPQVRAREMLKPVDNPRMGRTLPLPDTPVKLSRTPGGIKGNSPDFGEDLFAVLSELAGFTREDVNDLLASGVSSQGRPDRWPF
ncbi:MAG TPA: CaiB/BaiF CoA-transferase family protein [Dehalococcoidia bacterium]|nr:CaiB/BaiF CoA-transferase family protein [Dehalococcoidia bacterium]